MSAANSKRRRFDLSDMSQIAWAAGVFDGEGWVALTPRAWGGYPMLEVGQSGFGVPGGFEVPEMLHRLYGIFGGTINGPYMHGKHQKKPRWTWRIAGYEGVQASYAVMYRWLGPAKREQGRKVLLLASKQKRQG